MVKRRNQIVVRLHIVDFIGNHLRNRVEKAASPFTNYYFVWISRYREKVQCGSCVQKIEGNL